MRQISPCIRPRMRWRSALRSSNIRPGPSGPAGGRKAGWPGSPTRSRFAAPSRRNLLQRRKSWEVGHVDKRNARWLDRPRSDCDAGARSGHDGGPVAQYGQGARQLAHGPSRLQQFAALDAHRDQSRQRQGPQAEIHLLDRRTCDRRNPAGQGRIDPAGGRRLHVRGRHLDPRHEVRRSQRHERGAAVAL